MGVLKSHGFLNPNDPVAISFWIISISMVASTVFFLMESMAVGGHWKTSMNVGALVTLVAAVHYFFGYLMGGVADCTLNLVYNLADFVNKIAFCLAIWASAKKDTAEKGGKEILLA